MQEHASFNQDFNGYVPACKAELTAYNACQASTTAANWVCTSDLLGLSPYAPACDDLLYAWFACAGF